MHNVTFLQDMAVVMAVSAAVTIIFHQLRLPVVLGYIIAGIIIGPHTPPFPLITNVESIQTLSELGVIFLLFGIGLEFSFSKLLRVGLVSVVAATMEILLMFLIGFSIGKVFLWTFMDSLFLGAILSISSTTIIAKILMDTKKLQEQFAQIILGILVIEDILAIVIIAILSGLASTGEFSFGSAVTDLMRVGAFISGTLFLGALVIPWLLRHIYSFESSEMMIITVLGFCFAVSLVAAKLGFSVALGAFLIGAIMAETPQVKFIIRHFEPIRDMFTAVFFVSIGMLFDPHIFVQYIFPIVIISIVTIVAKVCACSFATFLTGSSPATSLRVGLGLAQVGEFSFIIAQMGETAQATSSFMFPTAVAVSALTTLTTPILMKYADPITYHISRIMPKAFITFTGLYSKWIEKICIAQKERSRRPILLNNLKVYLPRMVFYLLSLFGSVRILPNLILGLSVPHYVGEILLIVTMFPFLVGFLYTLDAIIWQTFLFPFIGIKNMVGGQEIQNALHRVLRFVIVVFMSLILLLVMPIVLPGTPVGYVIIAAILMAASVLWGSVRKIHANLEKTVLGFFDKDNLSESNADRTREELVRLIQTKYPWGVETQDFILPLIETPVNCPIKELRLREQTGATIVAVYRDERVVINPVSDTVLVPGDVLLLMGTKDQMRDASQFLNDKIRKQSDI